MAFIFAALGAPIAIGEMTTPRPSWHFAIAALLLSCLFLYAAITGRGPSFLR
jgi:hypothetical protein